MLHFILTLTSGLHRSLVVLGWRLDEVSEILTFVQVIYCMLFVITGMISMWLLLFMLFWLLILSYMVFDEAVLCLKVATALLVMTTCFKQWASYETVPVHGSE